jgi:N utilization substance protein A
MKSAEMAEAIRMIAADRGLSVDALLQVLVEALATAYKKRPGAAEEVIVGINPDTMDITFTAYDIDEEGNWVNERDDTPEREELGRIAASTFRSVLSQRIREVEREGKFDRYRNSEGTMVSGRIQRTQDRYTLLDISGAEALLPHLEQVASEMRDVNTTFKVYIVEVRRTDRGPQIVVSRTHPGLFELEVPEVANQVVQITAIAREPGQRTKIAVASTDPKIDPIGACVGARGDRVKKIVTELRGEKIDVINYSDDKREMIINAMSPARVTDVRISDDGTQADVIVPDFQLSLAIGRQGINAKLAAQIVGMRLDVKSESEAAGIVEPQVDTGEVVESTEPAGS